MRKTTILYLQTLRDRMLDVRSPSDLARVLRLTPQRLTGLSQQAAYSVFNVPKRDGSLRCIEDPVPALKSLQRALNEHLQAVYYFERSEAAYGFVVSPTDDPFPRHIIAHAERHLDCRWLLNVDLEDFFHQIHSDKVEKSLQVKPFECDGETAALIGRLCTWNGRLPMGAPTSPVLSNLAFREEDKLLTFRSRDRQWLYTRYADDLTFSSRQQAMTLDDLHQTVAYIEKELGFRVHPEKQRFSDEGSEKSVTRLILKGDGLTMPDDFYTELDQTMADLSSAKRVQHKMGVRHTKWMSDYTGKIEGMLGFAKQVLGAQDAQYQGLLKRYQDAVSTRPEDFGAYSWLDFPYL